MEFLSIHLFKNGSMYITYHFPTLYHLNAMADSSTFVQSVENSQHNVDVCINSALAKAIEENRYNSLFCQIVFYFVDGKAWHLGKMVDLDIMVSRKFFLALMKVFNWLSITLS